MNQDQWFQNLVESGEEKKPSSYGWSAKDKTHNTTKEDLDAFLADSMAKLTVEERERELEQLHGCLPTDLLEDPLEIETKLKLLDHHLNSIKQGTVYEVAESMNRTFVSSRAFRITFLRADRYNPQEAVMRIIRFLEIKRSLFGTKKLVKKITLADLDKDDMECLKDGTYQILPVRDMAGRVVIIGFPHLGCKKPADNRSRASYYSIMTLIESEETQKRGISGVWYAVGTEKNLDTNRGILWNLPIFRAGVHICSHNQIAYILSADAIYRLPTEMRPRIRVHVGSHQECQNTLNSFGIPRAAIPLSDDNIPHVDNHLKWLEQRRAIEETGEQKEAAIVVTDADVLFGRYGTQISGLIH
jgi:hypothetical protein